jgi:hypothetical protein
MRVSFHGVQLDTPPGWEGRASTKAPVPSVSLEAASTQLKQLERPDLDSSLAGLQGENVYVRVDVGDPPPFLGNEGTWRRASLPVRIDTADLGDGLHGGIPVGAVLPLVVNERAVMVTVGFGSMPTEAMLMRANKVLATLVVE